MHILSTLKSLLVGAFVFLGTFLAGPTPHQQPVAPAPISQVAPQGLTFQYTAPYDIYHIAATEATLKEYNAANGILGASNLIETPVAVFHSSLANAISSTANTFTLTSAITADGNSLASSTYSFVIDSGQPTQEFVEADCTGVNCTNVQRGLSVVNGTSTVSSNEQPHRRTASVDIVDAPLLLKITSIINGITGLQQSIFYATEPNWATATGTTLVTLNKLNTTAFGGAVVNVASGGTGSATQPQNMLLVGNGTSPITSTSSPTVSYITATTSTATSTFAGSVTVSGSATIASSTVTGPLNSTGTTTIAASSVTNKALVLNSVPYQALC